MVRADRRIRFSAGRSDRLSCETDDGRLNVDAPPFGDYAIGDNVTVLVSQRAAWAVAGPAPSAS